MQSVLISVLLIILGWLLGIISPGLTSRISNHYKKLALKKAIICELNDLKIRLAYIPLRVHPGYGTLDKQIFRWVQEQTSDFTGLEDDPNVISKLKSINLKDEVNIEKLITLFNTTSRKENPAFHFKKMEICVIDSNLNNTELLDSDFLTKLLKIKFMTRAFNEEVATVNEYVKMTFDSSMTAQNHGIIQQEIIQKNNYISKKAVELVSEINKAI